MEQEVLTPAEIAMLRELHPKVGLPVSSYANPDRPMWPIRCRGCLWGKRLPTGRLYCSFSECVRKKAYEKAKARAAETECIETETADCCNDGANTVPAETAAAPDNERMG